MCPLAHSIPNGTVMTAPAPSKELQFLERMVALIKSSGILNPGESKVIEYVSPEALKTKLDLSLSNSCENLDLLEGFCKKIIEYCVKTNSYKFRNQLYGGTDLYGLSGTWLAEALNTSQYTFEVAPVFTLIEKEVISQIKNLVGYKTGDGIFCPGGTISNMYAITLARFRAFPLIKTKGMYNMPVLVAFTSEEGHYSIVKSANWLGIGTDNVIKVKSDKYGRMIPDELKKEIDLAIEKGHKPFFVNATVATTVLGAIDPLGEIWKICRSYKLWCHIDACLGGSLLFSGSYKNILSIASLTDSLAWNPHKMLGAPLQCSVLVTSVPRDIFHECNSASAEYLFQQDKYYDVSYDSGDKSVQCGRKVDAFKLWLMWKARGPQGFEKLVDGALECANYFKRRIEAHINFMLVQDEFDSTIVCFWYIPKKLLHKPRMPKWWCEIYKVPPVVKEHMVKDGCLMIGYAPLPNRNKGNCFRMVVSCHPAPTFAHMDYVIAKIVHFGELE